MYTMEFNIKFNIRHIFFGKKIFQYLISKIFIIHIYHQKFIQDF